MKYDYTDTIEYLLDWFSINARILPWRKEKNPYYIWISEIMLQQTRVEAVKGYFERFITALPTITELAEAEEEKLMKLWEGLGYYNRARNLKKAAEILIESYQGQLPADYQKLLKLPGIGSYTAGAIASIAFNISEPAVDGNVLRVLKRIAGSFDDITKSKVKKQLEEDLREIMPEGRAGDYNQALMELGAVICLPNGKPLCEKCPVIHLCSAFHQQTWDKIPVKPVKKTRKIEERTIFVIEQEDKFLLHKRSEKGLLAGMWELPNIIGNYKIQKAEEFLLKQGFILSEPIKQIGKAKHIFSHIEWHMMGYYVKIKAVGCIESFQKTEESKIENNIKKGIAAEKDIQIGQDMQVRQSIQTKQNMQVNMQVKQDIQIQKDVQTRQNERNRVAESFPIYNSDFLFATKSQIEKTISLPSAFEAYRTILRTSNNN